MASFRSQNVVMLSQILDLSFNPPLMKALTDADAALLLSLRSLRVRATWPYILRPGLRRGVVATYMQHDRCSSSPLPFIRECFAA